MKREKSRGFSLLELMVVVAIVLVVAVLTVPSLMTQVRSVRIQYSATDLSGALQRARMEAVRKNSFFSLQRVATSPVTVQVIDKNSAVVTTIPPIVLGDSVDVAFGAGSGAPGESGLLAGLSFTTAASTATNPSFNARGLPCIPTGNTCTPVAGQGFVFFLSGTSGSSGTGWAAVSVTPSGRCQVWSYTGSNWARQ